MPLMGKGWSRRVPWCAVVAVPVVTLTAFLDPLDTFAGALHLGWGRLARPEPRVWLAGDVASAWPMKVRPPGRRPRLDRRVRPRGRVRP